MSKEVTQNKRVKKYTVYEDGKVVFEGSMRQVMDKLKRSNTYIIDACHYDTYVNGKYKIKETGTTEIEIRYEAPIKRKPVVYNDLEKDPLKFLVWHLTYKGNTSVVFDPEPYMDQLKEIGIECRIYKMPNTVLKKTVTSRGRKPKTRYHYLVERI